MDIKSMTTEQLKAILWKDCNSDSFDLGDEERFAVLAELSLREGKSSEAEAKEAWQRFLKYYVPGVRDIVEDVFSGSSDPQDLKYQ